MDSPDLPDLPDSPDLPDLPDLPDSSRRSAHGRRVLPPRPSLERLRNEAKQRLKALRKETTGGALPQLAAVQFELAQEYGFRSWRAMKRFVERAAAGPVAPGGPGLSDEIRDAFDAATWQGSLDTVRTLLHRHPELITGYPLETIARRCVWHRPQMAEIARLMMEHGARAEFPALARCGLLEEVIRELEEEPSVLDEPDSRGRTALYRATCVYGSFPEGEAVADELMRRGARIDLFSACTLGNLAEVRKIVAADPDAARRPDPEGMAPLHWACRHRRNRENAAAIVRLLCECGADPEAANPTEEGMHPLHHCGEWSSTPEVAAILLEFGAAINAPAANGWTPLDYAIDRARHGMARFLGDQGGVRSPGQDDAARHFLQTVLKAGADGDFEEVRTRIAEYPELLNQPGPHPLWGGRPQALHLAIEQGNETLFGWLLEAGADINGTAAQYDGWNPLLLALYRRRQGMAAVLAERGASVGLPEALLMGDDRRADALLRADPGLIHAVMPSLASPLRFAVTPTAARRLLELGAPLEKKDRYGKTPLEAIASEGAEERLPVLRVLVEAGARTPPWVFAALGNLSRFQAAAEAQAGLSRDAKSAFAAIAAGRTAIVEWMLGQGLAPDTRNPEGSRGTLLHAAAWEGNLPLARRLVAAGADVHALDEEYRTTPAQWARTALSVRADPQKREACREIGAWLEALSRPD